MQDSGSSAALTHGSFTEALLNNHESIDYYNNDWYSNIVTHHVPHISSHSFLLPSMLASVPQPTSYFTEQSLARLIQQQAQHHHENLKVEASSPAASPLPTTLPLPLVPNVNMTALALAPSGSPMLPSFLPPAPIPQPILHTKSISIPEFTYTPNGLDSPADSAIWQLPEPLHRNYYHTIQFRVPSAAYATTPGSYGSYEGYRVYIHPDLGYSGNAKRFKQAPEAGEKAFILEGQVLDSFLRPITQCAACEEYFENKSYFVANPHCKGRILLIKNNQVNRIKNNVFSLNLKPMCCSRHHQSAFYLHFQLRDTVNYRIVMSTLFMSHVKQWKKTTNSLANKRRKISHTGSLSPSSSDSGSSPSHSPLSSPPQSSGASTPTHPGSPLSSSAATTPDIHISGAHTPPPPEL